MSEYLITYTSEADDTFEERSRWSLDEAKAFRALFKLISRALRKDPLLKRVFFALVRKEKDGTDYVLKTFVTQEQLETFLELLPQLSQARLGKLTMGKLS